VIITFYLGTVILLDQKKVFNLLIQGLEESVEQNVCWLLFRALSSIKMAILTN
jgi:hypothetical protein